MDQVQWTPYYGPGPLDSVINVLLSSDDETQLPLVECIYSYITVYIGFFF